MPAAGLLSSEHTIDNSLLSGVTTLLRLETWELLLYCNLFAQNHINNFHVKMKTSSEWHVRNIQAIITKTLTHVLN